MKLIGRVLVDIGVPDDIQIHEYGAATDTFKENAAEQIRRVLAEVWNLTLFATKSLSLPGNYDCLGKALETEPQFTLLARDTRAPQLLREWADLRRADIVKGERSEEDLRMCQEADECADQMEEWRKMNDGTWREPEGGRAYYNEGVK